MYFATEISTQFIDVYIMMLNAIINNENDKFNSIISNVIDESKRLVETNNFYQVSSERFEIVNLFAQNRDLLDEIDASNLSQRDFEKLRSYLMNENPAI